MPSTIGPTILSVGLLLAGGFWSQGSELDSAVESALDSVRVDRDADAIAEIELDGVHTVNTHRDGEPIHAPVIEVDTGAEPPDLDVAYRVAAAIVRALRPAVVDEHVRQYDVTFVFGETSWTGPFERETKRIAVTPELLERLDREPDFDAVDLRAAIEEEDDGDDEIPPVGWGEPLESAYYRDDDWSGDGTAWTFLGT